MIEQCLENWHLFTESKQESLLDELLADEVVFYSPVVFTPQQGKTITKAYLLAAVHTLAPSASAKTTGSFRYIKEVASGQQAVLEFETEVEGKYINGVDMITCNEAGKIVEFKVMLRPLQAVNLVHQQMAAMLEKMKP